ncbi:MAG: hypothetical protein AB7S88_02600 [Candidatus Izemoplasmatales bacterium]
MNIRFQPFSMYSFHKALFLIFVLSLFFGILACDHTSETTTYTSTNTATSTTTMSTTSTLPPVSSLGYVDGQSEFDFVMRKSSLSDLQVEATYLDGTTEVIRVLSSMISDSDLALFLVRGTHFITVQIQSQSIVLSVRVLKYEFEDTLHHLFDNNVIYQQFDIDFDTWLEIIESFSDSTMTSLEVSGYIGILHYEDGSVVALTYSWLRHVVESYGGTLVDVHENLHYADSIMPRIPNTSIFYHTGDFYVSLDHFSGYSEGFVNGVYWYDALTGEEHLYGLSNDHVETRGMVMMPDETFMIFGMNTEYGRPYPFLTHLDADGNLLSTKVYQELDWFYFSQCVVSESGMMLFSAAINYDYYALVVMDSNGNVVRVISQDYMMESVKIGLMESAEETVFYTAALANQENELSIQIRTFNLDGTLRGESTIDLSMDQIGTSLQSVGSINTFDGRETLWLRHMYANVTNNYLFQFDQDANLLILETAPSLLEHSFSDWMELRGYDVVHLPLVNTDREIILIEGYSTFVEFPYNLYGAVDVELRVHMTFYLDGTIYQVIRIREDLILGLSGDYTRIVVLEYPIPE